VEEKKGAAAQLARGRRRSGVREGREGGRAAAGAVGESAAAGKGGRRRCSRRSGAAAQGSGSSCARWPPPSAVGEAAGVGGVGERDEGQQRKKPIAYQRSELGDALVGIVIHVVTMISTEAAFQTIGF